MKTPLNTILTQDLTRTVLHTYHYRWPPNSCTISYLLSGPSVPMTLDTTTKILTV